MREKKTYTVENSGDFKFRFIASAINEEDARIQAQIFFELVQDVCCAAGNGFLLDCTVGDWEVY